MAENLLVFADDWGRHPSSCQHLVRQLLGQCSVTWVNTIGTRPPRLDLATMRRGFEKLRHWTRRPEGESVAPANLEVLNPKMWPWFSNRVDRWLNRRLLAGQLTKRIRACPEPPVAITTLPIVADLMDDLPVRRWVYYCVDDFGEWPGLDGAALRRMEDVVVRRADRIIAVSRTLQDKLYRMGRTAELLTHGVDIDFWRRPDAARPLVQLKSLQRPLIVFWGVIDRRLDVAWLNRLADDLTHGTIVLAGPEDDPDPALSALPRTVRLGPLLFEDLPQLAREAAVLVMPYADLPVTRMMQPLKLKEYLATGKPTVVRDLPATGEWRHCADVVDDAESFSAAIMARLNGLPESQRQARTILQHESWANKARCFARWALEQDDARELAACG